MPERKIAMRHARATANRAFVVILSEMRDSILLSSFSASSYCADHHVD
jgi:hypothetical protein